MRAENKMRETLQEDLAGEASIHKKLGELLGLKGVVTSEVDLIARLEKGLAVGAVRSLQSRGGLSDEELHQLIAPRRTLNRREAEHQPLSADEADRAIRIARATARAQKVFSAKPDYAREWLRCSQRVLGGRTPLEVLTSEPGARAVDELLIGIEHGMFGE